MSNDSKPAGIKIEIYKLANRLKMRLGARYQDQGPGFLAAESIEEADKLLEALSANCPEMINKHLEKLATLWAQMREMPTSEERNQISQEIFTIAHEIKDLALMAHLELIAYFAESLRDYIDRTDLNLKAQVVIIQAHVDALQIANRQGFAKEPGAAADELKKMVKMAIDKYS